MKSLGDRMKGYESAFDTGLPWRLPVVVRVDGRAFHTLLRGYEKPWDKAVEGAMDTAAIALCEDISGAKLAYIQSDEISVLVHGYENLETEPWFGARVQKMASVAASIAAVAFSRSMCGITAAFDARVFVLPEAEVANYLLWRQRDAERNSIQSLARSVASHRECEGLNNDQLQELAFQRGANWNDLPTHRKRGRCCYREMYEIGEGAQRHRWVIDPETPRFTNAGRDYIKVRSHAVEST